MDNLLDTRWMSMAHRATVRASFRWTVDEGIGLLDRVQDEDGLERGSFSSCIYWLFVGHQPYGDHFIDLAEQAALRAGAAGRLHAAGWALVLRVYWAGKDGREVFDRLLAAEPALRNTEQTPIVADGLATWGYISL